MQIRILELIEGARAARGLTVIIDVFRAFSTACYVFSNGVDRIIPVGSLEKAYQLKKENNDFVLMGEREGKTLPGFDYGNSPALIKNVDFSTEVVVHTTSAGTQGIINAVGAREIITGSFVNAASVARYIINEKPEVVSLVCMGNAGVERADEDVLCALYLKGLIRSLSNQLDKTTGSIFDSYDILLFEEILSHNLVPLDKEEYLLDLMRNDDIGGLFNKEHLYNILREVSGQRFFEAVNQEWSPVEDFKMCLNLNIFNFILKVKEDNKGLFYLVRGNPPIE